jgi:ABC-type ATPase involved in cell division
MNVCKAIRQELARVQKDQERYSQGRSMDYKYRYWSTSGKADVLKRLLTIRKPKRKDIEDLKQRVLNKYEEIRKIPKAERNIYQTFDGIYLEGKLDIINNWIIPLVFSEKA